MTDEGMRYGYADMDGSFVIAPSFACAHPFTALGVALVEDGADNRAVVDKTGNLVIPWRQASILVPHGGLILLSPFGDGTGSAGTEAYDVTGRLRFSDQGDVNLFSDGLAVVYDEGPDGYGPIGYMDEQGELRFYVMAADLREFVDGLAYEAERYGGPQHYIDKTGRMSPHRSPMAGRCIRTRQPAGSAIAIRTGGISPMPCIWRRSPSVTDGHRVRQSKHG
jgi:hypothetical protein